MTTNMGKIELFHNRKRTFVHIPVKLEYCGNVKKSNIVTLPLFSKKNTFLVIFLHLIEYWFGRNQTFSQSQASFFDIPIKF